MALAESRPVVVERMVLVFRRQWFAARELFDDVIKEGNVEIAFHGAFVVALEYACSFDIERPFVTHRFNSAKAISRGNPCLLGSLPISSVSRIACRVSGL